MGFKNPHCYLTAQKGAKTHKKSPIFADFCHFFGLLGQKHRKNPA
jgi:hypothetical protein